MDKETNVTGPVCSDFKKNSHAISADPPRIPELRFLSAPSKYQRPFLKQTKKKKEKKKTTKKKD